MRPLTGELLNAPSEQVCSLPSTEQQEQHQSSPLTISPSNPVLPSDEGLVQASNVRMDGLTEMELEELLMNGEQHPVWREERVFNTNARSGRPFKLPSFPIKAIWCKTVICLMDMECELPPMLDASVSPLHGRPRYLTEQEDYIFNHAPSASLARWRVYSPLRNYVGPEVEEMVDFGCAIDGCNQFFETRDMVVDHVFDVHKIFPPGVFKCSWEECDREDHFGAFYQVETHMQRHKVDRPYPCTMDGCTKSYRRLENLRTHLRTHSGEKPYKCKFDYCDRCFTNASDRAKHETRTHSEVKSFGCCLDECVKLYTDPSSLRKHIINSHGAEFYEEYKREKALERKRKIEQRMIERHILRSIHVSTGGSIRVQTSCRNPASATTASRGRRSQNNASLSPRSTLSSGSTVASTPFSQISPLPVENTVAVVAETPMNLTMPAILHDIPRPSPPPTTTMYQFPLRPTPIVPNPTFHIPQLAPLHPMLPLPMGPLPIPTFMPPMGPGCMSPQMINAMIMARLQMLSLNQQF